MRTRPLPRIARTRVGKLQHHLHARARTSSAAHACCCGSRVASRPASASAEKNAAAETPAAWRVGAGRAGRCSSIVAAMGAMAAHAGSCAEEVCASEVARRQQRRTLLSSGRACARTSVRLLLRGPCCCCCCFRPGRAGSRMLLFRAAICEWEWARERASTGITVSSGRCVRRRCAHSTHTTSLATNSAQPCLKKACGGLSAHGRLTHNA